MILGLVFCFISPLKAEKTNNSLSLLDVFSLEGEIEEKSSPVSFPIKLHSSPFMTLSGALAKLSALCEEEEGDTPSQNDSEAFQVGQDLSWGKEELDLFFQKDSIVSLPLEKNWGLTKLVLFSQENKEAASAWALFEELRLKIFGRKVIGIKYKDIYYLGTGGMEPKEPLSETDIEGALQVKVEGGLGEKILVNVDYDDTLPGQEQQKFSLRYEGGEDEIIQEAAVGNLQLGLPHTEFLNYNRSLLGAKVALELGKFSLVGIGAINRGILETKTFTGEISFEKKDIFDTAYLRRKYFQIYFDPGHLPLTLDSADIYIDNPDTTNTANNETSVLMTVTGEGAESYTGHFDKQHLGEDYLLDCEEGIIYFLRNIEDNYIIAVSYRDKNGKRHPQVGYRMIKKGRERLYIDKYELRNYYYLGQGKIRGDDSALSILDLSGSDVTSDYTFEIDYQLGILKFTSPLPPFPYALPPFSSHSYTIYVDFYPSFPIPINERQAMYIDYSRESHTSDTYLLRAHMVPESERVYINGEKLSKDRDYQIDYSSGSLNLLDSSEITDATQIKVDYEWMPFAESEGVVWGARLEFTPQERLSLGSTFLSQLASPLSKVPHLGSVPSSGQVLGLDTQYDFSFNLGRPGGSSIPLQLFFSAELGKSNCNPNTFGKAMLENFESSKVRDELSMDKDAWQPGSKPNTQEWIKRDEIEISSESLPGGEINPGWSSEVREVLVLGYNFSPSSNWDSLVYPISSVGRDYSQRSFLELWIKGEGGGEELTLDLGMVSEDVDGDGILDTEDKNGDGKLGAGEDRGIDLGGRLTGAGNGRLDTEDLDGNGELDTFEIYARYEANIEPELKIDWVGWKKITLSLKDAVSWNSDRVKCWVKHLRLCIKGEAPGTLKFALISILGDRWQEGGSIQAKAVNSEDDSEYNPFSDESFRDYYEAMYGDSQTPEGKWKREAALRLALPSGGEGWVEQTFVKPYDYTDYETINFWIFGDGKEENFYLRIGADVSEGGDYYEKEVLISWNGWRMISIPLRELSRWGSPSFENIKQLRAGIKDASGPVVIYLNDIFLSGVEEKEGLAKSISLGGDMGESFSFTGQYKEIEGTFSPIGHPSSGGLESSRLAVNLSPVKSLPFSYRWSKEEGLSNSAPETEETEKVIEEKSEYDLAFLPSLPSLPRTNLKIQNIFTGYPAREEKKKEDTWRLSLEYKNPFSFPLLPTYIQTSWEEGQREYWDKTQTRKEEIKSWEISLPFQLLKNLSLKPVYTQKDTDEIIKEDGGKRPKLREESLSFSSEANFFHLSPHISFRGICREDNFSLETPDKRNIFTEVNFSLTLPLEVGAFFSESAPLKSLKLYARYELTNQRSYEDTTAFLDLGWQSGLKEPDLKDGRTKLLLEKENFSLRERWRPFNFLSLASEYSREERKEIKEGIACTVRERTWPSLNLSFDFNKIPSFIGKTSRRLFANSYLIARYIQKTTIKEGISSLKTHQPSLIWRGDLKGSAGPGLTFSYKSMASKETFFSRGVILRDFSSSWEAKMDCLTSFPKGAKIPFLAHFIDFKNKIHFILGFNFERKKRYFTPGKVDVDNLTWKLFTQAEYKVGDNVQMRLGLEGGYLEDKVKAGEGHYFWGGSARVEVRF